MNSAPLPARAAVRLRDPALGFALPARRRPGLLCAVSKLRGFLKNWLPVIACMVLIFSASSDRQSSHRSSRLIEPFLRWLFPQLTNDAVWWIVLLVRKLAHLTEFALLALLLWRALRRPGDRSWSWCQARNAWLIAALYAASDEWHQWFVPDRQASAWDVLIDASGAAAGLVGLWALGCWRKWWLGRKPDQTPTPRKGGRLTP